MDRMDRIEKLLQDKKWKLAYVTLALAQLNSGMPRFACARSKKMEREISALRRTAEKLEKKIEELVLEIEFADEWALVMNSSCAASAA